MNKNFSVYLDLTRFLASLFVFIDHLVQNNYFPTFLSSYIPEVGRESVIIFFVLSGFVISYTTTNRKISWQEYALARTSRIYSVALPILLLAFVIYSVCIAILPSENTHYQLEKFYLYIPFHLAFIGEFWTLSEVPPWLASYWSLSYEVWYYIFFGVLFFMRGAPRIAASCIVLAIMGYKLWLLLPIWLSGVWLYKQLDVEKISHHHKNKFKILFILSLISLIIYKITDTDILLRSLGNTIWPLPELSLGSADRYIGDYLVTFIVLANFYFAFYANFSFSDTVTKVIRFLASFTFTLYLIHMIFIMLWQHFFDEQFSWYINLISVFCLTLLGTYFIGSVTEHKKNLYAELIIKFLPFLRSKQQSK